MCCTWLHFCLFSRFSPLSLNFAERLWFSVSWTTLAWSLCWGSAFAQTCWSLWSWLPWAVYALFSTTTWKGGDSTSTTTKRRIWLFLQSWIKISHSRLSIKWVCGMCSLVVDIYCLSSGPMQIHTYWCCKCWNQWYVMGKDMYFFSYLARFVKGDKRLLKEFCCKRGTESCDVTLL